MILEIYLTNQTIKKVAHFDFKKKKKGYALSKGKGPVWYHNLNKSFQFLNNITHFFTHFFTHTYF